MISPGIYRFRTFNRSQSSGESCSESFRGFCKSRQPPFSCHREHLGGSPACEEGRAGESTVGALLHREYCQ